MLYLTTLLFSIIVTIAVMPYAKVLACRLHSVDEPNQRKIHESTMPKCGGMAMTIGAMVPIMLWAPITPFTKGLILGTIVIVCFGIADDIKDLNPYNKLIGQLMGALAAILIGGVKISNLGNFLPAGMVLPDILAVPLTAFVIVGVTNATNLSDGLDGLAGGIGLLIFLCIGYIGVSQNDWIATMIAIAVGGAVLGFLRFNSHPAQLFMGDAGSQLLGFVAILLSIKLTQQSNQLSVILPLIIFGLPILDTLTVMTKRLIKGRSPFSADRNHFHHQLIEIGLFHTEAVMTIYIVQSMLIFIAIVYRQANDWYLLIGYICFAGAVVGSFNFVEKSGYRINRDKFLKNFKLRLQPLKDRGQIIKFVFPIVKFGVPALLLFNAMVPIPGDDNQIYFSGGLIIVCALGWLVNKEFGRKVVKACLYVLTPFVIYRCDQALYMHLNTTFIIAYNFLYLMLLIAVFLTMKLTRRMNGFKGSTLDFLVIFVILLIPNLPGGAITGYHLGLVAVKTVILFYSYEVLMGETRKKKFGLPTSMVILMISVKTFIVGI